MSDDDFVRKVMEACADGNTVEISTHIYFDKSDCEQKRIRLCASIASYDEDINEIVRWVAVVDRKHYRAAELFAKLMSALLQQKEQDKQMAIVRT